MNFPLTKLCFLLLFLNITGIRANDFSNFVGTWTNDDADIPKLSISIESNHIFVQAWGKCGNGTCNWGRVSAKTTTRTSMRQSGIMTAAYEVNQREAFLSLSTAGDHMKAQITWLIPASGKKIVSEYIYYRVVKRISDSNFGKAATGAIQGKVVGPAKSISSIFHASLYGPNNGTQLVKSTYLSSQTFNFSNLPDGTYWLVVDCMGSTIVQAFPDQKMIIIKDGEVVIQNVELK